jgi:hypothetical protein
MEFSSAGDYNHDGNVDAADYLIWRTTTLQPVANGQGADGNGDGFVNGQDYFVWRRNFGSSYSGRDRPNFNACRGRVAGRAAVSCGSFAVQPPSIDGWVLCGEQALRVR